MEFETKMYNFLSSLMLISNNAEEWFILDFYFVQSYCIKIMRNDIMDSLATNDR